MQVAADLGDKVKVLKIDTDQNPELSSQLQVQQCQEPCHKQHLPLSIARLHEYFVPHVADTRLTNHGVCWHGPHQTSIANRGLAGSKGNQRHRRK